MNDTRIDTLRNLIRDIPDFPKPGILFRDITPLLANAQGFRTCIDLLSERLSNYDFDTIAAIESRGFIFGAALATRLGKGFVPVRKPGKLPYQVHRVEYALEYGTDALEMHIDCIRKGFRVLLVDDLIATGGTAWAAAQLIQRQEAQVIAAAFVIDLVFLKGAEKLSPIPSLSLIQYT